MNARIKSLIDQATVWQGMENGYIFDKEKFAQLIVRECIKAIDDSTPVYSSEDQQDNYCQGTLNGYQSALLEIKQHFGVKI